MKYVVADSKGRIVKTDAHRSSEAINWARNRVSEQASVRKVPEIIKIVNPENENDFLLVADEETAKQNGWTQRRTAA